MVNRTKIIQLLAVLLVVIAVGIASYLLGNVHAVQTLTFKRITPTQAANAMKNDNFYANYRENTLLVTAVVSSISKDNNEVEATFKAASTFQTRCDFGNSGIAIRPGETITVLAEGGVAERQPSAVLLKNCLLL